MRGVLQNFIATLSVPANVSIRDAADLSHLEEVIKSVLQHCIKTRLKELMKERSLETRTCRFEAIKS